MYVNGVDVEGIRPREVEVYLLGSEMGGNANLGLKQPIQSSRAMGSYSCLHKYQS